ncbi:MAG: hypothetical protein J6V54_02130 [Bacteroidales bacterium]|nr:hypothetical protein [Bacteroidales bacterium]
MYQTNLKYNIETPPKTPFTSTGKERNSETGFSYFGARYYDSDILTGWLSVDPMADKYPSLSPYNYCALNPIRVIDPNGDSCAVLLAGNTLWPVRHMAVLVQKEDEKWYLYSKDGDDDGSLKTVLDFVLGTPDQVGNVPYSSVQDFLDNYRLKEGDEEPYYTEAYVLPTTPEQDKTIRETMINELDKKYNLIVSNCAQAVNNSLKTAGVNTNKISLNDLILSIQCFIFPLSIINKFVDDYIIPITIYGNIKHANPNYRIATQKNKENEL